MAPHLSTRLLTWWRAWICASAFLSCLSSSLFSLIQDVRCANTSLCTCWTCWSVGCPQVKTMRVYFNWCQKNKIKILHNTMFHNAYSDYDDKYGTVKHIGYKLLFNSLTWQARHLSLHSETASESVVLAASGGEASLSVNGWVHRNSLGWRLNWWLLHSSSNSGLSDWWGRPTLFYPKDKNTWE